MESKIDKTEPTVENSKEAGEISVSAGDSNDEPAGEKVREKHMTPLKDGGLKRKKRYRK